MTWHEAMERYGTDKPDLRFGMELVELTEVFGGDRVPRVRGRRGGQGHPRRRVRATWRARKLDALTDRAKSLGRAGPRVDAGARRAACSSRRSRSSCPRPSSSALVDALGAVAGDLVLIVAGDAVDGARRCSAQLRLDLGRPPVAEGGLRFVWVVDFPLFEGSTTTAARSRAPPVHDAAPRRHRPARVRSAVGARRRRTTSC